MCVSYTHLDVYKRQVVGDVKIVYSKYVVVFVSVDVLSIGPKVGAKMDFDNDFLSYIDDVCETDIEKEGLSRCVLLQDAFKKVFLVDTKVDSLG